MRKRKEEYIRRFNATSGERHYFFGLVKNLFLGIIAERNQEKSNPHLISFVPQCNVTAMKIATATETEPRPPPKAETSMITFRPI